MKFSKKCQPYWDWYEAGKRWSHIERDILELKKGEKILDSAGKNTLARRILWNVEKIYNLLSRPSMLQDWEYPEQLHQGLEDILFNNSTECGREKSAKTPRDILDQIDDIAERWGRIARDCNCASFWNVDKPSCRMFNLGFLLAQLVDPTREILVLPRAAMKSRMPLSWNSRPRDTPVGDNHVPTIASQSSVSVTSIPKALTEMIWWLCEPFLRKDDINLIIRNGSAGNGSHNKKSTAKPESAPTVKEIVEDLEYRIFTAINGKRPLEGMPWKQTALDAKLKNIRESLIDDLKKSYKIDDAAILLIACGYGKHEKEDEIITRIKDRLRPKSLQQELKLRSKTMLYKSKEYEQVRYDFPFLKNNSRAYPLSARSAVAANRVAGSRMDDEEEDISRQRDEQDVSYDQDESYWSVD